MRKKAFCFFILIFSCFLIGSSEISSLSQVFMLGKGLKDLDEDGYVDKVAFQIIIPDNPTVFELAVASDIAARANLESLIMDLSLVKRESEIQKEERFKNSILIGTNLKCFQEAAKNIKIDFTRITEHQGLVSIIPCKNQKCIALVAGSGESLLQTGRAFFLRWPYFWEIWGREEGETYFTLEKDLQRFLKDKGINTEEVQIQTALYEFFPAKSPHDSIKRLRFNTGEIKNLFIEISFPGKEQENEAFQALEKLRIQHNRGQKTDIFSYSGCAQITFILKSASENSRVVLPRMGYPKRILTPSYKRQVKPKISGKDFDLTSLFSAKGLYSDSNKDGILDTLDSLIIIPQNAVTMGAEQLTSRLTLGSAGASFPILSIDKEIENEKALKAPILIGQNNKLNQELLKTAKLKIPPLQNGRGAVKIVPQAFNESNALTIFGADPKSLEKTLVYLSKTFPYLDEYKEGNPRIDDIAFSLEEFLKGKYGSAESYFQHQLESTLEEIRDKEFEFFKAEFTLPQLNKKFENSVQKYLQNSLATEKLEVKSHGLLESKTVFEKEKEFPWEADAALEMIKEKLSEIKNLKQAVNIQIGVSESPEVREKFKMKIKSLLAQNHISKFDVEVCSSYKQGFFWIIEKVIPTLKNKSISRLIIRFAREKENFRDLKRFYSEPFRWLQELYPVDEIITRETQIPIENIIFEMKEEVTPLYEVLAYDDQNNLLLKESFSPRTRKIPYLKPLPEWGNVKLTTGWVTIESGNKTVLDCLLKSDLESFWDYFQEEILPEVHSYVLKKTGNEPSFSKQPYFKKLQIEMWFSEPDYKLGLDEEIVSSLEAIHDEIYFDTLDFLRGITDTELEDENILDDTSRYSAPGNVFPLVHPSIEGGKGRVKVLFEDWQAPSSQMVLKWKEKGKEDKIKKIVFPSLKAKKISINTLIYNGMTERIEDLHTEVQIEKEKDYLTLIEILDSLKKLQAKSILSSPFRFPRVDSLTLKIKFKDLVKEESIPVVYSEEEKEELSLPGQESFVPTNEIISPQMCLDIVHKLSSYPKIKSFIAGKSYENRKIPVLEIFTPLKKHISYSRLITFKPTLLLSGRQHANEVSSTNYILKFAELLAKDPAYQEYSKKVNFVFQPMENPDGAELAYNLQKITPFHSLHAGRYSSLGIDIGLQVNSAKSLLPEANVRQELYQKWLPDIYLNLHGYPSHEWVQQFSNYSPYLFREYWIPRGWFVYFRSITIPLHQNVKEAGEELKKFIQEELKADKKIHASNENFYNRYFRWAARWQPHMNYLELSDGVNLYAKRRSSQENRLTIRRQMTFVEETPELMDETAHGPWLDFLCQQGLAYLKAHTKYLAQAQFEIARIEEESQEKIHIQFMRSRPGKGKN